MLKKRAARGYAQICIIKAGKDRCTHEISLENCMENEETER
ncbi:MAG: hypothetical protein QXH00_04815 [Candidatus Jordarchaeales archaeon]